MNPSSYGLTEPHLWLVIKIPPKTSGVAHYAMPQSHQHSRPRYEPASLPSERGEHAHT